MLFLQDALGSVTSRVLQRFTLSGKTFLYACDDERIINECCLMLNCVNRQRRLY